MKKYFTTLLVLVVMWHCRPTPAKVKTYFFYNSKAIFKCNLVSYDSVSFIDYGTGKEIFPKRSIEGGWKAYELRHYLKFGKYKDTSFVKHKSYIDSIEYYGTEWLKKEDNLDKFWKSSHGRFDSLKIYIFEPVKGTDSLIFRRVHRYFDIFAG